MELALDSSALTEIFGLPPSDRDAVIAGLRTIGRIRITTVNILEAAGHQSETARGQKLRWYRELTGEVNPLDAPNELLEKTATAHHERRAGVSLGSQHAMQLLHEPDLLTPDLIDESFAWNQERRYSFKNMHEELRTTYQAHFKNIPGDRASNARDLITYFCERLDTYLDMLIIPAYQRASGSTISRDEARTFMANCDAWRIYWAARVHALYMRSIQTAGYSDRKNAGITDMESSIYLAFIDYFVTADRKQYDALRDLNAFTSRDTAITWYDDLRRAFLLQPGTMGMP